MSLFNAMRHEHNFVTETSQQKVSTCGPTEGDLIRCHSSPRKKKKRNPREVCSSHAEALVKARSSLVHQSTLNVASTPLELNDVISPLSENFAVMTGMQRTTPDVGLIPL